MAWMRRRGRPARIRRGAWVVVRRARAGGSCGAGRGKVVTSSPACPFFFPVVGGRGRRVDTTGRMFRRAGTARETSRPPTGEGRVAPTRTRKSRPALVREAAVRFSFAVDRWTPLKIAAPSLVATRPFHARWSRRAARVPRLKIATADAAGSPIFTRDGRGAARGVTTGKKMLGTTPTGRVRSHRRLYARSPPPAPPPPFHAPVSVRA